MTIKIPRKIPHGLPADVFFPSRPRPARARLAPSRCPISAAPPIASDMPLSLIVYDDAANRKGSEAFAQGDGPPRGRELEIADILRFIKTSGIANTVWLTADVHYTAAHYYNPDKAQFQDFEPFWEFVSGPLHAGTFGPNELDNTFGPEVKFIKAPGLDKQNLPPSAGMQFFGHVKIEGATGQMTVTLRDRADVALWSTTLDPKLD
jgi:alkaline phosphatase D